MFTFDIQYIVIAHHWFTGQNLVWLLPLLSHRAHYGYHAAGTDHQRLWLNFICNYTFCEATKVPPQTIEPEIITQIALASPRDRMAVWGRILFIAFALYTWIPIEQLHLCHVLIHGVGWLMVYETPLDRNSSEISLSCSYGFFHKLFHGYAYHPT